MPSAHDDPPGAEPSRDGPGHARTGWDRLRLGGSLKDLVETRERVHAPWFGEPEDTGPLVRTGHRDPEGARGAKRTGTPRVDGDPRRDDPAADRAGDPDADAVTVGRLWTGRWRVRRPKRATSESLEQRSLFGEILDWMFAPLLLRWPLSVAITFLIARSLADAPFDRALDDRTQALAQQVRVASERVVVILPRAARDFLAADDEDTVYYQVVGGRGKTIAGEADLPRPGLYDYPEPGKVRLRNATYRGDPVRIGYLYIDLAEGEEMEPVLVQVAETLDRRTRLANEIIKGVIFPQFMILPVAVLLVWFALSRGLSPLKTLQRRIRGRDPDDVSPIDPRGAPEEIAPLVDAFNDLLERQNAIVAAQKRFIADAAHQMKTPLAGLRTQSELAIRERDPVEQRRALEQIARSSQRAAHLVSQLLALARMENLRDVATLEPLDLDAFAREAVSEWVPVAIERGIDLGYESERAQWDGEGPDASARIAGHPVLLGELANNLIDNALRYTPRDGTVTVRVVADGRRVLLEIEDSGPGIPESDRELVFERFYRVLGTGVDGSGLGLPIVREIAIQHGATIEVDDARPGQKPPGTRFTVTFPVLGG
ncbi:MAG: sensor histidine kinase [Burkholderiales bacterium]